MTEESPLNPLPPLVVALFLVIIGLDLVFTFGARGLLGGPEAVGWRLGAIQDYGFSADVFRWMLETGRFPTEHMIRFVSYPFVQGSFTSALFAGVMLLAMGKFVAEVFRPIAVLTIFLGASIVGAVLHGIFMVAQPWLIGAFPGVYGLIGAFTFLLWVRLAGSGASQARAFSLIGMLMGLQLIFGVLFGTDGMWLAELGGFFAGFALSFVLAPGGWSRVLERLRGR
jgi:membrane associated rhomboid family serine protease